MILRRFLSSSGSERSLGLSLGHAEGILGPPLSRFRHRPSFTCKTPRVTSLLLAVLGYVLRFKVPHKRSILQLFPPNRYPFDVKNQLNSLEKLGMEFNIE